MRSEQRRVPLDALAPQELEAARRLLNVCNRHEGLDLPIFLDEDSRRYHGDTTVVLDSKCGELLGMAWAPADLEDVCGIVHPQHRRRGIGRRLLHAVREEGRGLQLRSLRTVSDAASPSGGPFLTEMGLVHVGSEQRLELDVAAFERAGSRVGHVPDTFVLSRAGDEDLELLVGLQTVVFGDSPAVTRAMVRRGLADPARSYYIARVGGTPVGMLRVGEWAHGADVTAFGVRPEYRGRSYGRSILTEAVATLIAKGWDRISLEVETDNAPALALYGSCGFTATRTYNYHEGGV